MAAYDYCYPALVSNMRCSIAGVGSSGITRLPPLMPMLYQACVFWIGEGDREE